MSDEGYGEGYFGPPHLKKSWEQLVPVPLGQQCLLCQETIAEGDIGTVNGAGQVTHYECQMRSIIGSVGHQMRRCSCYGGTEEDPPGLTARQAAQAALDLWTAARSHQH